ncbi:TonB-dependent hemoglobin/transferrin/lactoferrin family receptor [Endozoicomonas sp. SM1973]|uniref:TonB-dependent hemoglobin/transferrin/lactoferrin family receptor n=1 Tax=Spartinivicinus marinus TaxID=2994442 RepID=A0A853II81_9GAMM|nr:TonB-dependent hemoglobin/transferrin/lactoferrin family receptor [Spartinivicinus marinus]MCX4026338.1 TonB-dependent hemoglobin/transferrin/lactoferrin family receptor [Spartinivicinus marinus]NYZ67316.1 TonB-dependent hemoglobin/transferrin/lactoferrin family receptor [Spartinivicinus marinus]
MTEQPYWQLTALASALAVSVSSWASQKVTFDEVVVTATRSETTTQKEPKSVDQVDSESISLQQPDSIADTVKHLSNVQVSAGPRKASQRVNIRGLDERRIVQVIDGARQNFSDGAHRGLFFIEPELLKSVEVVKGASGSLWGSGAIGGAIGLTTIDADDILNPDENVAVKVKQGYQKADHDNRNNTTLAGRLGNTDYLLSTFYTDSNELRLGSGKELENSASRHKGGLAKWRWHLAEDEMLKFTYHMNHIDENVPSNPSTNVSARSNPLINRKTEQNNWVVGYELNPENNDWVNVNATLYHNYTKLNEFKKTGAPRHDSIRYSTTGLSLVNTSELSWVDWTYGLDYYQDRVEGKRNGADRPEFTDGRSTVWGVFTKLAIPLGDYWTIQPGLRFDQFDNRPDDSSVGKDQTENELSKSLAISYNPFEWLTLHALYDEAFRAPSLQELYVSGTHFYGNVFVPNPNLKPEEAKNKELSTRFKFNDLLSQGDILSMRLTYFKNDVDNYIEQDVERFTTTYVNVRDAELKGYEFDSQYKTGDYGVNFSYGRTRGKDKDSGQYLQNIPADKTVVGLERYFMQGDVTAGVRVTHAKNQDRVPVGNPQSNYDGYTVTDIYVSWEPSQKKLEGLRVDFGIDNVTDRHYRTAFSQLDESGINAKVAVSYKF